MKQHISPGLCRELLFSFSHFPTDCISPKGYLIGVFVESKKLKNKKKKETNHKTTQSKPNQKTKQQQKTHQERFADSLFHHNAT